MTHYCPKCGEFSWHASTSAHWALECPACGHVAKQHPHPPAEAPRKAAAKRKRTPRKAAPKQAPADEPDVADLAVIDES